ncbi:MAG: thiamine diphosphokinase [Clostridiales Family XIII bacterium]|nr:thiamine diphosphokinase [Clostridiales Family XIII bacterium]
MSNYVIISAYQNAPLEEQYDFGEEDYIACADGGFDHAISSGIRPDIVIGDFDSCSVTEDYLHSLGIAVKRFDPIKDDTDTLLCVRHALAHGFENIVIIGGLGGSFDHTFANIQTLSFLADMEVGARIETESETVYILAGDTVKVGPAARQGSKNASITITGKEGQHFSVFSYEERTSGVYIEGAKYELHDSVLTHSYPIGARNEFLAAGEATIKAGYGRLLITVSK